MTSARESLLALRDRMNRSKEKTKAVAEEVKTRREQRRVEREKACREVPCFNGDAEVRRRDVNSVDVQRWLRAALNELYQGRLVLPAEHAWWTLAEKKTALMVLRKYGADVTKQAVEFFVRTWPERVRISDGNLSGYPNIKLFGFLCDRIVGEMTLDGKITPFRVSSKKKRMSKEEKLKRGEWTGDPLSGGCGIGWGDGDE
jgi:hypothetical protein